MQQGKDACSFGFRANTGIEHILKSFLTREGSVFEKYVGTMANTWLA